MLLLFWPACQRKTENIGGRILPGHPRLILTGDFLELTRKRCRTSRAGIFARFRESVDRQLKASGDSLPVRDMGRLAEKCGFLYLVTGDKLYLDKGLQFLGPAMERYVQLEREQGGGYWETVEFRRYCAFGYDWLWSGMSASDRERLGRRILEAGRIAWEKQWFNPYGGGGYGTLDPVFWPAVALAGTGASDSLTRVWFDWTDTNIHEWRKMQSQVAADDGGMYSGMAYAAYNYLRTPIFDFEIWKDLTGEDLTENNPYLRWFAVWWLYCAKPNGEWLRIDDAGSVKGTIQPWHFKYLASRYGDPVSLWYLENRADSSAGNVWDVLWDPADLGIRATGPDSTWPLARHFEGLGWVILRSGWEKGATHAVFDCGDFYYGHQHPGENSFLIFKRGSLAINSGRYEWGSDHRPNYAARTIASNTLLVYDPQEVFAASAGERLSNDGGQLWPLPERTTVGQSKGTPWDTGEITAFETNPRYSYACGDATRAYNPKKLTSFTRQLVHLQPDLFIIFDRVEATDPAYKKYWLLHTVNEPVVRGRQAEIRERGGTLFCLSILPEDARMIEVGGPGQAFEVFGKNYPPALTYYEPAEGEEWGAWRIEVSPGAARKADCFLHVLLAADSSAAVPPEVKALGAGSDRPGVQVKYNGGLYELRFSASGPTGGNIRLTAADGSVLLDKPLAQAVQPQSGIGN